jgi:two-component system phosphate regulon sensor histidine kinase PhoR
MVVLFALIVVLIVIQYFWISAMVNMRKSMMSESIFLAFNESAYEIIGFDKEISDENESANAQKSIILPNKITPYKAMIDNTIRHYFDNHEIDVPYYWAVVERHEMRVVIDNDLAYLQKTKTPGQTYRISSMYYQFPYDLIIVFFSPRWQIPKVVYSTIFILGFCLIILVMGIIYNTRLYYQRQKETESWIDFIGNLVHEFKTPMATISLSSEMMMKSNAIKDSKKIVQYSSVIYKENNHLRKMIDKLLRTIALDMDAMKLDMASVDIHEETQKIIEGCLLRIKDRKGTLTTNLQAENHIIIGDKMHVFNVISNLLENAEKYSEDAPKIHVETKNDHNGIYLTVKDHGIGISSKHLKKLFNRFYRVRSNRSYSDSGYGLGLFYVNYVMHAHKGNIRVTSKEGSGSKFELYFPFSQISK